jgi:hypothetical protein
VEQNGISWLHARDRSYVIVLIFRQNYTTFVGSLRSAVCLNTPDAFLKPEGEEEEETLAIGKLASPEELLKLARRWDAVGRVALFRKCDIDERDISDCFPVLKEGHGHPDPGVDRQIIDRRRRNQREERLITGSQHMPHSVLLNEISWGTTKL